MRAKLLKYYLKVGQQRSMDFEDAMLFAIDQTAEDFQEMNYNELRLYVKEISE